ncbi:MAG: formimidoylglutamase [Planctomycetota bacterium]
MAPQNELWTLTRRPDPALFYHREDPNDKRLGEVVLSDPARYSSSDVVIVGCPQDEGVRRNMGRLGSAEAPRAIRAALYRATDFDPDRRLTVFDLGDVDTAGTLEAVHARLHTVARDVLASGKRLVVLGGGNDISHPDASALRSIASPVLAFNIDTHFDVRADAQMNSGTAYRRLLEEGVLEGEHFYEMACQDFANSPVYERYLKERGVTLWSLEEIRRETPTAVLGNIINRSTAPLIFFGFDMDSVRSADAPGVSAPSPTGLSAEEAMEIARLAGQEPRARLFEITEMNPKYDIDGRTARLAALMVRAYLKGCLDKM